MATMLVLLQIIRFSRGFIRLSPIKMVEFARNVGALMTGNTNFLIPVPALTALIAAADNLANLNQLALNGDRIAIAARAVGVNQLVMVLVDLGTYVQGACLNSLAILLTSGFYATKPRSTSVVPTTPTNVRLSQGDMSGSLLLRFKKDKNTRNSSIQTATPAAGPWTDYSLTTKSKETVQNRPKMAVTWARGRANGAAGSSEWSEPTCKAVV